MFKVNRQQLHRELSLLKQVSELKGTIPILSTVKMQFDGESLVLTATSLDVTLITEFPATGDPWEGCVPLGKLSALVGLLTDDEVELKPKESKVQLGKGSSKHLLPVVPVTDFPEIEVVGGSGVQVDAKLFSQMMAHITFAAFRPSDTLKPEEYRFTGAGLRVKNNQLQLVATDRMRFGVAELPVQAKDFELIIPRQAFPALQNLSEGVLTLGATQNMGFVENGSRRLLMRLIDGRMPNWDEVFPREWPVSVEISTNELGGALKRVLLTTEDAAHFVTHGTKWILSKDQLQIESKESQSGKSVEVLGATSSVNGEGATYGVAGAQVLQMLGFLEEQVICEFQTGWLRVRPVTIGNFKVEYYSGLVNLRW